jgi:hypothetical protein
MTDFLFSREGQFYVPAPTSRGPWSPKFLHGGPPAALLAHALEGERGGPQWRVTRITIDLFRPVPYAPLELRTRLVREGKRIRLVDAWIMAEGIEVARCSGLILLTSPGVFEGAVTLASARAIPPWQEVPLRHFIKKEMEGTEFYHARMQVRRVETDPGEAAVIWMRTPQDLLPGRSLTPLERVASVSDFASATGQMSRMPRQSFINADISLALHREPEGEWICLEGAGRGDHDGIMTSSTHFHDGRGLFGHGMVTGMANSGTPLPP